MKFSLPKIATAPFCPPEVAGSVADDGTVQRGANIVNEDISQFAVE